MAKKFFIIAAATLLFTGAWGDTAPSVQKGGTIEDGNINFTITSETLTSTPSNSEVKTVTDNNNGSITLTIQNKTTKTYSGSLNVTATSLTNSFTGTTLNIANFNKNANIPGTSSDPVDNTFDATSDATNYSTYMQKAIGVNNNVNIIDWNTIDKDVTINSIYIFESEVTTDRSGNETIENHYVLYNYNSFKDHQSNYTSLYFIKKDKSCYAISSVNVSSSSSTSDSYNVNYKVTALGENLTGNTQIEIVTLSSPNISTIAPGAFKNDAALQTINKNANFAWYSSILYNAAKTELIVAGHDVATQTLPTTVTKIYDYALAQVDNKITITAEKNDMQYTPSTHSNKVTFNFPTALTATSQNGGKGYKFTGSVNNDKFAEIYSSDTYKNCKYLDFSGADIRESIEINNASKDNNRLYYFPNNASISGNNKNVVIGTTCSNFVMKDKKDFFCPKEFTASKVSFDRSMTAGKWGTVVLPYAINLNSNSYWIGEFSEYTNQTLKFTKRISMEANKPYIFKNEGSSNATPFNISGSTVIKASPASTPFGDVFKGTYEEMTVQNDNNYGYSTSGTFVKCNGNKLSAFRGYFHVSGSGNAPEARYFDENDEEVFFEENASAIEEIDDTQNNTIYTLNGQQVNNTNKAGIYIINNKKVIIK